MKVKVLSRSSADYTRERSNDIHKLPRNLDPALHPFEKAREYTRALTATKIDRVFAKPFVGALSGHADGVYCLAKHPTQLDSILSGSGDGELRYWSLSEKKTTWSVQNAHRGIVRGISIFPSPTHNSRFLSVGSDKLVKIWAVSETEGGGEHEPISTYVGKNAFTGVHHHRNKNIFATSGARIDIWDESRSEPIDSLNWGVDTINTVKMNQTEVNILASCGSDRSIVLYDLRTSSPLNKTIMTMKSNAIAWNPMEAFNFTVANEDHNCYTFDMRKMSSALNVLKDHVSAVLDLDYSPTGEEIVTGSYDRSLRIFEARKGHSRDIYHTKRMQRLFCVNFTMDAKYVLSGSDDGNIRLWKAKANERLGTLDYRERAHLEYTDKLKERYKDLPEIKRIARHRHVPKAILNASKKKRVMLDARAVKTENLKKHSKSGAVPHVAERKKNVMGQAK